MKRSPMPRPRRRVLTARRRLPLAAGAVMLWVALAPWLWGFAGSHPAVANHFFFTFAFGPLTLMIVVLRPAAVVALGGGIWLALSPWVLGYASNDMTWLSALISGGLLTSLCWNATGLGAVLRARTRRGPGRSGPGVTAAGAPITAESISRP